MDPTDVSARLTEVFRDVFDDPQLEITPATTAREVDAWDSIKHIDLIVAVEKAFGVKFTTREAQSMRNVGELMNLIVQKGRK